MIRGKQLGLSAEIIVDSFAGGGGASTGIEQALGHPVHVAINHDARAVDMHAANHPYTQHFCEDVWQVNPRDVRPGDHIGLLWASPDCKHFSKAKGGAPVSKRVRGLAWVVVRWAAIRKPRLIALENVEEFITWGPLLPNGMPDPKRKGITFKSFVRHLQRLGYAVEWRELRACDYGAPTIRKRLFLIARCDGRPIVWPTPTHGRPGSGLKPWRTAAEIIDWSIPCPSIFDRPRPLADNTLRRIAKGLQKYVINNANPFIVPIANYSGEPRAQSADEPLRTVTASPKGGSFAVVDPYLVKVNHGYDQFRGQSAHEPLQTITAKHGYAVVTPYLAGVGGRAACSPERPVVKPFQTVTTKADTVLVAPTLVQVGYGERPGQAPRVPGLDKPLGTVVAGGGKHALVAAFLAQHNGCKVGVNPGHAADKPLSTITGRGTQQAVVTSNLIKLRGTSTAAPIDAPLHTVTGQGQHHAEVRAFLIKYFGTDQDPQLQEPLHTVTTKDRFGIVYIYGEPYQIVDIGMRMLTPRELYLAQGFPPEYIIDRTADGVPINKTEQVRMCGNSVSPVMARVIVQANMAETTLWDRPAQAATG